jgi:hypothetical protein
LKPCAWAAAEHKNAIPATTSAIPVFIDIPRWMAGGEWREIEFKQMTLTNPDRIARIVKLSTIGWTPLRSYNSG